MTFSRGRGRDLLVAISLANLHFLATWTGLLAVKNLIYRTTIAVDTLAVTVCILGLAAVLFVSMRVVRRLRDRVDGAKHLFLLALVIPLHAAQMQVPVATRLFWSQKLGSSGIFAWAALMLGVGVLAVVAYARNPDRVRRAVGLVALVLVPLLPVCLIQAFTLERSLRPAPNAPSLPHGPGQSRRLLWVVFDEMDYPIAFTHRPAGFALPNIDRLRGEAFFATAAQSPSDVTNLSIPSYFAGRQVTRFVPVSTRDAMITYSRVDADEPMRRPAGETIRWRSTETIFDRVRALGLNAAVAGTGYLPYCRVFGERLTRCATGSPPQPLGRRVSFALLRHPSLVVPEWPGISQRMRDLALVGSRSDRVAEQRAVSELTRSFLIDPSLAYIFAHFSAPHPPYVSGEPPSYYGNLTLVDSLVGALRRSMEAAGIWDSTTVIISSDHGLRPFVPRRPDLTRAEDDSLRALRGRIPNPGGTHVPLVIKLAGDREGLTYTPRFDGVILGELSLKLLRGELRTAGEVARWIDGRRLAAPAGP